MLDYYVLHADLVINVLLTDAESSEDTRESNIL